MISMSRKKTELNVIRAEKLPSGMITGIGVSGPNCWVVVLGCGVYQWWTVLLVSTKICFAVGTVAFGLLGRGFCLYHELYVGWHVEVL